MESAYQIATGKAVLLSEQQIVDCSVSYGNNGCSGGLVEYAYNYAKHVGIETEEQYPYKAANTKCQVTSESDTELLDQTNKTSSGGVQLSDFKDVERFSPE